MYLNMFLLISNYYNRGDNMTKGINRIVLVDTDYEGSFHTSKGAAGIGCVGIQYIGRYLHEQGKDVTVLVQDSQTLESFADRIISYQPDLVGVTNMLVKWDDQDHLAGMLKSRQDICAVVGGPGISGKPDLLEHSNFDYGIKGEGERALFDLIEAIENSSDLSKVSGLIHKAGTGVTVNPVILQSEEFLSSNYAPYPISGPAQSGFDQMTGIEHKFPANTLRVGQLTYSRGCPNSCSFCDIHELWGKSVRWASEGSVVKGMKYLREQGFNYIFFTDLTFNSDRRKLLSLTDRIIKDDPGISYFAQATVKNMDGMMLDALVKSGCTKINFGIEALTEKNLSQMNKTYRSLDQALEVLELANSRGLITRGYMIMPWESYEDIETLQNNLANLPVDEIRLSFMTPLPGTRIWSQYADKAVTSDLRHYGGDFPLLNRTTLSSAELIGIRDELVHSFYASDKYLQRAIAKAQAFPHLAATYQQHGISVDPINGGAENAQ